MSSRFHPRAPLAAECALVISHQMKTIRNFAVCKDVEEVCIETTDSHLNADVISAFWRQTRTAFIT